MSAYYNELDPYAAQWLRNLISAGHIAPGEVDTRSIEDVRPDDLVGFTQCHFFAGIGVWSAALRGAGWPDDRPVWTGSCPCQPFSSAGKGGGFADERHLWPAFFHLIAQCRPRVIFGEQVASKDGLAWVALICTDLEETGHAFAAFDLCAAGVGAPHVRQRLFWVAHAAGVGRREECAHAGGLAAGSRSQGRSSGLGNGSGSLWSSADWLKALDKKKRPIEPGTLPLVDGAVSRVGRLRAYGNAIVQPLAEEVIAAFMDYALTPSPQGPQT